MSADHLPRRLRLLQKRAEAADQYAKLFLRIKGVPGDAVLAQEKVRIAVGLWYRFHVLKLRHDARFRDYHFRTLGVRTRPKPEVKPDYSDIPF